MVERSRRSRRKRQKPALLGSHQRCWLWGRHVVWETLNAGKWPILELHLATRLPEEELSAVREIANKTNTPLILEAANVLTKLCGSQEHQGYLAKMPPYPYDDLNALLVDWPSCPLFLLLDGIQDPYNLGAILRSAEVLAADAVILGTDGQAGITSLVARSSAGAVNYLTIVRTEDLSNVLDQLKERNVTILGASEKSTHPIYDVDLTRPLVLLIGNEGTGIRPELLARCDQLAAVPQAGRVGSLNAAVSAGILLYEVHRQRHANSIQ